MTDDEQKFMMKHVAWLVDIRDAARGVVQAGEGAFPGAEIDRSVLNVWLRRLSLALKNYDRATANVPAIEIETEYGPAGGAG